MFYVLRIYQSLFLSLLTVYRSTGLEAKSPTSAIAQHPPPNYTSSSRHIQ